MAGMTRAFDLRSVAGWFRLVAFVAPGLLAGIAFEWTFGTWALAVLAGIAPLASVVFVVWADRTNRLGLSPAAVAVAQPGRPLPETT